MKWTIVCIGFSYFTCLIQHSFKRRFKLPTLYLPVITTHKNIFTWHCQDSMSIHFVVSSSVSAIKYAHRNASSRLNQDYDNICNEENLFLTCWACHIASYHIIFGLIQQSNYWSILDTSYTGFYSSCPFQWPRCRLFQYTLFM